MIPNILGRLNLRMPPDNLSSWLMLMGFCLVAFSSVVTVVLDADITQQAPLHALNILILILMWCLRAFGHGQPRAATRLLVWFLATLIMAILTWSMTKEAPLPAVKVITCVFVVVISLVAFYSIFFKLQIRRRQCNRDLNACLCFCIILILFNSPMASGTTNIKDWVNSENFYFFSWLAILILYGCITGMVTTQEASALREGMKVGTWVFGTMLALMFSAKVAEYFSWLMKHVVVAMAVATSFGIFYAFFIQGEAYFDHGEV